MCRMLAYLFAAVAFHSWKSTPVGQLSAWNWGGGGKPLRPTAPQVQVVLDGDHFLERLREREVHALSPGTTADGSGGCNVRSVDKIKTPRNRWLAWWMFRTITVTC